MTEYKVGDKVTIKGVITDVDPNDKTEMYCVSFRANYPDFESEAWFCEADLVPAEPEQVVAPEYDPFGPPSAEETNANRRQQALHMAIDCAKVAISAGDNVKVADIVATAKVFEEYMAGGTNV